MRLTLRSPSLRDVSDFHKVSLVFDAPLRSSMIFLKYCIPICMHDYPGYSPDASQSTILKFVYFYLTYDTFRSVIFMGLLVYI